MPEDQHDQLMKSLSKTQRNLVIEVRVSLHAAPFPVPADGLPQLQTSDTCPHHAVHLAIWSAGVAADGEGAGGKERERG